MPYKDRTRRLVYHREWYLTHDAVGEDIELRKERRDLFKVFNVKRPQQLHFRYQEKRKRLLKQFGGCCAHCGYDDLRALDFDHIHNDGNLEKRGQGIGSILAKVKRTPDRFQVLCKNCNYLKEWERKWQIKLDIEAMRNTPAGATPAFARQIT